MAVTGMLLEAAGVVIIVGFGLCAMVALSRYDRQIRMLEAQKRSLMQANAKLRKMLTRYERQREEKVMGNVTPITFSHTASSPEGGDEV